MGKNDTGNSKDSRVKTKAQQIYNQKAYITGKNDTGKAKAQQIHKQKAYITGKNDTGKATIPQIHKQYDLTRRLAGAAARAKRQQEASEGKSKIQTLARLDTTTSEIHKVLQGVSSASEIKNEIDNIKAYGSDTTTPEIHEALQGSSSASEIKNEIDNIKAYKLDTTKQESQGTRLDKPLRRTQSFPESQSTRLDKPLRRTQSFPESQSTRLDKPLRRTQSFPENQSTRLDKPLRRTQSFPGSQSTWSDKPLRRIQSFPENQSTQSDSSRSDAKIAGFNIRQLTDECFLDDLRHNCEMKLRDLQKKKGQILEDLQENRKHYDKESIFKSLEIFKNYKDIKEQINITKNDMIRIQKHPRYKISQRIIEDIIRKKREEMISKRGEDKSKEHD